MAEKIKILIGDKLSPKGLEYLSQFDDVEAEQKAGLSPEELKALVPNYHGLVIRSGVKVTPDTLEDPGILKGIARAGVGVDNIDLDASTEKGILVMNSAEASTITTAEHAFTLMCSLARNIGPAYRTMCEGGWDRNKFVGAQLHGRTLGVIGFGRIGQTMASRALAFGMKVVAFDPVFNAEYGLDGQVKMYKDLDEMLPHVDIVTFHVPLNDHTRNMFNAERFAKCKDGVMLVNAARGGIIEVQALLDAIESGKCGGAGIDVYEKEPLEEDSPLRNNPKILTTPHLGASTSEAQEAVALSACEQLLEYLRGEGLRGAVNAPGVRLDLTEIQMKHLDLAKRMSRMLAAISVQGVQDIEIRIQGSKLAGSANTVERVAAAELMQANGIDGVNLINVVGLAAERNVNIRTITEEAIEKNPSITINVTTGDLTRGIRGVVLDDDRPRVREIDRFNIDIVPSGTMLLIKNEDKPGMIGAVGNTLGSAGVNIEDMSLSKGPDSALMVLKVGAMPSQETLQALQNTNGVLKFALCDLPTLDA